MYEKHPSFKEIEDDKKIWRFMDLAKFCDFLERRSVFFTKPKMFKDPWEGHYTQRHFEESFYENLPDEARKIFIQSAKETIPNLTRETFGVNCWHINENESEALWRNYSERGIAIQSTFGKLKECFKGNTEYNIYIGKVEYKDHRIDLLDMSNLFNQILWKRKSFEYENELRAVIWSSENIQNKGQKPFNHKNGSNIKISPEILIEKVYTTPFEKEEWFNDLVKNLIKKYEFNFSCDKSDLMKKPNE